MHSVVIRQQITTIEPMNEQTKKQKIAENKRDNNHKYVT